MRIFIALLSTFLFFSPVSSQQGPDLILNTCNASSAKFQQWTFNVSSSKFFLTATAGDHPPLCIDISDFNTNPSAEVYTWPCGQGSGANEVWIVTGSQIKSGQTPATCLAATSTDVGSQVSTNTCNTGDALQTLLFDASTGLITHTGSGLCVDGGSPLPPSNWCATPPRNTWTFCNPAAALDDRAADIVNRLSVADKIQSLVTQTGPLPSVGLPAYQWWSEATQ